MEQTKRKGDWQPVKLDPVSRALSAIYTGVFLIDLKIDSYQVIQAPESVARLIRQIDSARDAIELAIRKTVISHNCAEMLAFTDLTTLPARMYAESYINVEYKGIVSGWIRGSFIEVERDDVGKLWKVIYAYQIVDREKRLELAHQQEIQDNYIYTEQKNRAKTTSLENEKRTLTEENIELTQAADAVHAILNSGSYVCSYSADGASLESIKYSQALRKVYGYESEEDFPDIWDSWVNCIMPEDRERVEESYNAALRDLSGHTTYDMTCRFLRKDGEVRWQRVAGYVIRRSNGSPITCYGLVMDVDEQKRAENKVKEALDQAKLASSAKTSFLARMSHDIRTPMNGIMGIMEINEQHADDIEFTSRNRKKAKIAANHLLSLINDVLQFSKLEDPNIAIAREPFRLMELMDDIFTIVESRANDNGITVKREDHADGLNEVYVMGSPLHVRQIFINILGNSIKYNKKSGWIFAKTFCRRCEDNRILFRVEIADTGIGMSEEFLARIYEPFAREHEKSSNSYEGTGLGMSIVKQLVDKMGGTIEIESEIDKGSRFTIEIPFESASESDIKKIHEVSRAGDIHGKRILLVEDNELNMEIADILLTDAGAVVTKASNGKEAVAAFADHAPGTFDVILMDVMMPVMDGYRATEAIRDLPRPDAGTIPIIAMTANAFAEDVEKAKQAGMNAHLAKPLDIHRMTSVIAMYT